MGAQDFTVYAKGKNAKEAFQNALEIAYDHYGKCGYTGSIAEKSSFRMVICPQDISPSDFTYQLMNDENHWVGDKWGPAGCLYLGSNDYMFFGCASS